MENREQRIYEEAAALWREVFHEAPPGPADGSTLLAIITGSLVDISYARLRSPHLRPSTIAGPAQSTDKARLG